MALIEDIFLWNGTWVCDIYVVLVIWYSKCINYSRLVWKKKRLVLKCCYVIKLCSVFSDSNVNIESIYLINMQFPVQSNSVCHWKLLCIANFSFPFGRILISLIMKGNNSFENESVRDKMKRRCFTSFFMYQKCKTNYLYKCYLFKNILP